MYILVLTQRAMSVLSKQCLHSVYSQKCKVSKYDEEECAFNLLAGLSAP